MLTGTDKVDLTKLTDAKLIALYIALRDKRKTAKSEFQKQQRPLLDVMEKVENLLMGRMNEGELTNISTDTGTAYKKERNSARIEDKLAFMEFIKDNHWEFLDVKANIPTVVKYMEEHEVTPPGVVVTRDTVINVRTK